MRSATCVFLLATLGSGCAAGPAAVPGPLTPVLKRVQTVSGRIRGTAAHLAAEFTEQARALQNARAAKDEPAVTSRLAILEAQHLALEALDEAEGTLGIVSHYAALRGGLRVTEAVRSRLDQSVRELVDVARALHRHAGRLVAATRAGDEPAAAGARTEVQRDRAALKAYRTDMGVSVRLFAPAPARRSPTPNRAR